MWQVLSSAGIIENFWMKFPKIYICMNILYCSSPMDDIYLYTLSVFDEMTENTYLLPLPNFFNSLNERFSFLR